MTAVILFVIGLCVGSFLNVVALRLRSGRSLGGRSACPHCGHRLSWYELVPVLGFLFLGGRCLACRSKISWRYPVFELWTGAIFVTVFNSHLAPLENALMLAVFCVYIVIANYDLRHHIIPNELVILAVMLTLPLSYLFSAHTLLDWLTGPILFAFFGGIWLLSRGRAIGFGDAKLSLSIGLMLGAAGGFSAAVLAVWIGAAWGIGLLLSRTGNITMKSELPFAPFLIIGAWAAAVTHPDLLHVSLFFS